MMQGASREAVAAAEEGLAAALRELPDRDSRLRLSDALFSVVDLLDRELALRRALADPAAPAAAKTGMLDALLGGRLDPLALELLRTMVRQRWSRPVDLTDEVESLAASSAFAAAEAAGSIDAVEDQLFRFGRILDREPELHTALTASRLPADARRELVRTLLADRVDPITRGLVVRAVIVPRGRTLERTLDEYGRLAARRRDRLVAQVTSAVPLDEARLNRLGQALARLYSHPVQLQVEIDPALVGGMVVRVGDEIIDGSVRDRLDDVRRRVGG